MHELVDLISKTEALNETILNFGILLEQISLICARRRVSLTSTIQASNQRFYEQAIQNSDLLKLGDF